MRRRPGLTDVELFSPEAVRGLTVLLERFEENGQVEADGQRLRVQTKTLEHRTQYFVTLDLAAGQSVTLRLASKAHAV